MSWFSSLTPWAAPGGTQEPDSSRASSAVAVLQAPQTSPGTAGAGSPDVPAAQSTGTGAPTAANGATAATGGRVAVEVRSRALGPRAKQVARKLPRWEDGVEDDNMQQLSDDEDFEDVGASLQSRAGPHDDHLEHAPGNVVQGGALQLPVLKSYDEAVLQLKRNTGLQLRDTSRASPEEDEESSYDRQAQEQRVRDYMDECLKYDERLKEEELMMEEEGKEEDKKKMDMYRAASVIVRVANTKMVRMRKHMKLYEEAETLGKENNLRARRLLSWMATLSVLAKFDQKQEELVSSRDRSEEYYRNLPDPPPPPPDEPPPTEEEEILHDRYEEMVRKYEAEWTREGHRLLGIENFNKIRNRTKGASEKQKKKVAEERLKQAREVLSESEHRKLLEQAWRLGDGHSDMGQYNAEEFARLAADGDSPSGLLGLPPLSGRRAEIRPDSPRM